MLAGEDFTMLTSTLMLSPTETTILVNVSIINDSFFELTESFKVSLSLVGALASGVTFNQTEAEVIIFDDDGRQLYISCSMHYVFISLITTVTELVFGFNPTEYRVHENSSHVVVGVTVNRGNPGKYHPTVVLSTHHGKATGIAIAGYTICLLCYLQ